MKVTAILYLFLFYSSFPKELDESARALPGKADGKIHNENFLDEDIGYSAEDDNQIIEDSAEYKLRKPSDASKNKLKKDKDLNYAEAEGPTNLFEFISAWINEQIANILQSKSFGIIKEYLSYFIAAAAIVIVIIILNKNKLSGIIYGIKDENISNFRETHVDIDKIDFDALISSSLASKEFRIAARYHYLKSLKLLSDKKIIDWKINKTNKQYMHEISNPELKKSFEELTFLFEWFWYGDYPLEESFFYQAQKSFNNFQSRLAISK